MTGKELTKRGGCDPDYGERATARCNEASWSQAGAQRASQRLRRVGIRIWRLEQGVSFSAIRWIKPREAWWLNRKHQQPHMLVTELYRGIAIQLEAMARATSATELFTLLEAEGTISAREHIRRPARDGLAQAHLDPRGLERGHDVLSDAVERARAVGSSAPSLTRQCTARCRWWRSPLHCCSIWRHRCRTLPSRRENSRPRPDRRSVARRSMEGLVQNHSSQRYT